MDRCLQVLYLYLFGLYNIIRIVLYYIIYIELIQIISSLMVNLGAMSNDMGAELNDIKRNLKQTQYRIERVLQ